MYDSPRYRVLSRQQVLKRVGTMRQLAGVRQHVLGDGPERGVRVMQVYNAAGLEFEVLADRGMDVGRVSFRGVPLAWLSPTGFAHPSYYEPEGLGWLRTFGGGFLVTCGLTYHGRPAEDRGEALGLHGRVSHLPAWNVHAVEEWEGDDYVLAVGGEVRETRVFGANLAMRRVLRTTLWQAGWTLEDRVTNAGHDPAEHMILYHVNLGFPLLDSPTRVAIARTRTRPRDAVAAPALERCLEMGEPQPGFQEQVYYHDVRADASGAGRACVYNPELGGGLALLVEFGADTLPALVEWKMLGEGTYVLGVEPGTSFVDGRPAERQAGRVPVLRPGEERRYSLRFSILTGEDAKQAFQAVAG